MRSTETVCNCRIVSGAIVPVVAHAKPVLYSESAKTSAVDGQCAAPSESLDRAVSGACPFAIAQLSDAPASTHSMIVRISAGSRRGARLGISPDTICSTRKLSAELPGSITGPFHEPAITSA